MLPADLVEALQSVLGTPISRGARSVGGGSIHHAVRVETSSGAVFVKYGSRAVAAQLEAESDGVRELARAGAVRTPVVLATGQADSHAYAVFEWIDFGATSAASDARLGEQLAQLHRTTCAQFGWQRDNFIGATPQPNAWSDDWIQFWRSRRLEHQLDLARASGASTQLLDRGERLLECIPAFFAGYVPVPSLIHGDLWSGNRAADARGQPVIFDPAVYFADREAELAMTHLFGGFAAEFYRAYESAWPCAAGADVRCTVYQLYHMLNHFNLFGGVYHAQAERMLARLLAEVGG